MAVQIDSPTLGRGNDWNSFYETEPLQGNDPFSPSAFGTLLFSQPDAASALDLLGAMPGGALTFADIGGTIAIDQLPPGSLVTVDSIGEDGLYFFDDSSGLPSLINPDSTVSFISQHIGFSDLSGTISINQFPPGTVVSVDSINEDAVYFFDNTLGLPKLISATDLSNFVGLSNLTFADIGGTVGLDQFPPGSVAALDSIDEDALYFFDNTLFAPKLINAADTLTFLGITGGGGTFLSSKVARVDGTGNDSTGTVGDEGKAFLTVQASLTALEIASASPGVVRLGYGLSAEDVTTSLTWVVFEGVGVYQATVINSLTLTGGGSMEVDLSNIYVLSIIANCTELNLEVSNAEFSVTNSGGGLRMSSDIGHSYVHSLDIQGDITAYNFNGGSINAHGHDITLTNVLPIVVNTGLGSSYVDAVVINSPSSAVTANLCVLGDVTCGALTLTDSRLQGANNATSTVYADVLLLPRYQMSIDFDATAGLKLLNDSATPGNSKYYGTDSGGTKGYFALPSGGSGDVVGPSSSIDSEVALFNSTTGKLIKRATGSGLAVLTSGVLSTTTNNSSNWDTAFTERRQWDGGATNLVAATGRTSLGLVIGTNVQAWDADLDTLAGLTATTDNFIVSVSSAWASRTPTQVRSTLGLVIGTNVQAWDADLDALAALSGTNNIYYRSAANTWSAVTIGSNLTFSGGTLSSSAPGTGTVTNTGGNLTANSVVLGAGTVDTKVVAGIISDGTSKLTLGVAGTSVGAVVLNNATSGSVTLQPVTGALGTVTLSLPATTATLADRIWVTNTGVPALVTGTGFWHSTSGALEGSAIGQTGTGSVVLADSPTHTTLVTLTRTALGATPNDGLIIQNTSAAANNAQQYSPRVRWNGRGWDSTNSVSKAVDAHIYLKPVQGAGNPSAQLVFETSINSGSFGNTITFDSAGNLTLTAITAPGTPVSGIGAIYLDSTSKNLAVKDDAGVVKHGVQSSASVASNFLTAISDAGVVSAAQPADSDISFTDITTGNASTSQHGFMLKYPGGTSTFLRADGTFATPGGGGTVTSIATTSPISGGTITGSGTLSLLVNVDHAFTAAQSITTAPASNTAGTGLLLTDTTVASSGNQQYSPAVRWTGQGWKTTATAASQAVDFRAYVVPVQGAANPSAYWTLESSINAGSFGNAFNLFSSGGIGIGNSTDPGIGVITWGAGQAVTQNTTAPTQASASVAGANFGITASNATAGSSSAGAAAGGAIVLTTGNAARLTSGNANGGNITLTPGTGIGTGTSGVVEQRNGTNAQQFNLYNTFTDANTYELGGSLWQSNTFIIGTSVNTGGTLRNLQLNYGIASTGSFGNGAIKIAGNVTRIILGSSPSTSNAFSAGIVNIADGNSFTPTSGTNVGLDVTANAAPSSTSTMNFYPLRIKPTINYSAGTPGAGNYEALKIAVTETALPTGTNYLIRASAGSGGSTDKFAITNAGLASVYNGITTAGVGNPYLVAAGRVTAQSAANASISTYTTPAVDGSYEVSMNMNVTAATALSTSLNCNYTDESNTARTMIFPVTGLTGSFLAGGLVTATGAFETPVMHIRCKASTTITLYTATGTFTSVTYTAEGNIIQTK